jgi:uncharacterized repeat protein (TIGR01451 family)
MKQANKLMSVVLGFGILTVAMSLVPSKPMGAAGSASVRSSIRWRRIMTTWARRFAFLVSFAIANLFPSTPPALAQIYSSATAEIGHDTSLSLKTLAGNVKIPQSCAQQPPQLLPNPTGLSIDQDFCGYMPVPMPLCPNDNCGVTASDNSGAAGPNHYFQTENFSAIIFDKTGQVVLGPFPTATFWSGFTSPGNVCSFTWSDAVVLYDRAAQRWFISRFAAVNNGDDVPASWYQCFAISATSDPTGQYYRYVFSIDPSDWSDYPKFGIWPDAYYMTSDNRGPICKVGCATLNPVGHSSFVVAFERSKMLPGQPAREIIFKTADEGHRAGMLPADWDGKAPPAGAPDYLARTLDPNMGWPSNALEVWAAQVDWQVGGGVLSLMDSLTPDAFNSALCQKNSDTLNQSCIPQPGTSQGLDPLAGGRPMYRLAYRNFGDHEALVFTQTVEVGDFDDHSGIRWYELRRSGGNWSIYQQGTFAPDSEYRWMGSIAIDRSGNIALGYNTSSSATFPGIRIAGRLASEPLGQLTEAAILQAGIGSYDGQFDTNKNDPEWADYSQTTLDPLDGCTFWYAGTYQPVGSTGMQFTWATKIGSFRFPNCVADLSISKTRSPLGSIAAGTNVTFTITVTNNGPADAGNITLSDNVPAGSGFVSLSSPAGWKCTNPLTGKSGAITCTNTSLADGASAIFTIVASVNCSTPDGTVVSNTASVLAETPPDNNHSNDSQSVSLTVFNPAPVVNASVGLSLLPQNDHNLVNVGLAATATDDACPAPTSFVVQVFGDEDDQTPTDSSGTVFSPDAKDIAVSTLRLRQERTDSGDGRVYLIVVKASDAAGGTGFATSIVVVPKSSSAANISSINAQAATSKAFADTHSGGPPPGYFIMGDGPVIGPKQ